MNVERVLRGILVGGVSLVPFIVLIVTHSTFFPFVVGKNFAFRALVEVLTPIWVVLMLMHASYRPRRSWILVSSVVFVCVVAVADLFGENVLKSVWSNFERMEGLVTLVHILLYSLMAGVVFASEAVRMWFWRISIAVATYVSLYAVAQAVLTNTFRLDATLGNPIYLAVYVLFHIFIALVCAFRPTISSFEKWLLLATVPLQLWVLFMTATRGASIGLVLGFLVTSAGLLYARRESRVVRLVSISVLVSILLVVGAFAAFKDSSFVQESRVLKRFVTISLTEGTVFARTVVWGMAWEGVKEKPLLGWGQENFNLVFNKYYDPRMYAQEPWFDRTHNAVFDWLIAAGVLGLLAYLSLFISTLWVLYRTDSFTTLQKWLLVGLLVAYGFHNLTVFDQIVSYILFFSLIAWVHATARDQQKTLFSNRVFFEHQWKRWLTFLSALIVGVVVVWSLQSKPLLANLLLIGGLQDASRASLAAKDEALVQARQYAVDALIQLTEAGVLGTYGSQEVFEHRAQVASRFASAEWMPEEEKKLWFETAEEGLRSLEIQAPGDARFPVFLGTLYGSFDEHEKAKEALLRAEKISPRKQSVLIELSANALVREDTQASRTYLERAYSLEPSYKTAGVLYAIRLVNEGDTETFDSVFSDVAYIGSDSRVLTTLVREGEHERAFTAWENAFSSSLEPKIAFLLARIYAEAGDTQRAIDALRSASAIDPRAQGEAEQVIKTLQ